MVASPDTAARRRQTGRWLLGAAWGIEILAALVGLFIAGASAYAAYDEIIATSGALTRSGMINVGLGALPFAMVAVVELTKIPMASAMFRAGLARWRWLFALVLTALVIITFETALNGFERNFSTQTRLIENIRRETQVLDKRLAQLDQRIATLRADPEQAVLARFAEREREVRADRDSQIDKLEASAKRTQNELANISLTQQKAFDRDKAAGMNRSRRPFEDLLVENGRQQRKVIEEAATKLRELEQEKQPMLADARRRDQEARQIAAERDALVEKRAALEEEMMRRVSDNQVYRITQMWTGIEDASQITKKDVRLTGTVWFGSIAFIVAACGTLLAFASFVVSEGPERVMPDPAVRTRNRQRLNHALRMLMLAIRKRTTRRIEKPVTVEKVVEVIHEIPVDRVVEKEVVREVPVDRLVEMEVVREVPVERVVEKEVIREVPVDRVVIKEVPREVVRREFIHVPLYTNDIELVRASQSAGWPKPAMESE